MDQLKIGKFIAERRKENSLTQMQLAEKLGITDKAVSKWERGIAMPDSSIMLDVCKILGISVNELLNGEKINMEEQDTKAEKLLLELTKRDEKTRKKLLMRSWILLFVMVFYLLFCTIMIAEVWKHEYSRSAAIILFLIANIPYYVGGVVINTMRIESLRFKCEKCGHEFPAPRFGKEWFSFHIKCPLCGNKQKYKAYKHKPKNK